MQHNMHRGMKGRMPEYQAAEAASMVWSVRMSGVIKRSTACGTNPATKDDLSICWFGVCVQPLLQKFFCFHPTQIICLFHAVPSHFEGRLAIVTDAGRDAVDVDVLLTRALKRTVKTCGPDASTLASSLR